MKKVFSLAELLIVTAIIVGFIITINSLTGFLIVLKNSFSGSVFLLSRTPLTASSIFAAVL